MSLTFSRNSQMGPQSMFITVVVPNGLADRPNSAAVKSVTYTVYQGTTPNLIAFSAFNLEAMLSPDRGGTYYAPYTTPIDAPFGPYTLTWKINLVNDETHFVDQLFYIEDVKAFQSEGASAIVVLDGVTVNARVMRLIKHLRVALRDNQPDRNYHAVPPRSSREVQAFSNRVGFIWTDEELLSYLQIALSELNSNNPKTSKTFQLTDFPDFWLGVIIDIASVRAVMAMALNWTADGFNYSISGLSLDLNKGEQYLSLKASLEGTLKDKKDAATACRPISRGTAPARFNI